MAIFLSNRNPDNNEHGIAKTINTFTLSIVSDSGNIIFSSVNIYINGIQAVNVGNPYPPFGGSPSGVGTPQLDYTLTYAGFSFNTYQQIPIFVEASNGTDNLSETYYFWILDDVAPVFYSTSPLNGDENQGRDVEISVSFYDEHSGIDVSTIEAYVDGYIVYNGEYFIIPFDGPNSELIPAILDGYDGYTLTIDRSGLYEPDSTVDVIIKVKDMEGN